MILLDTNHLTALKYRLHPRSIKLARRLMESGEEHIATTIIAYEEQHRGWMALLARNADAGKQVGAYQELAALARFFGQWRLVDFDEPAARRLESFRQAGIRVGTMDLKMAAIAMQHDALFLTANQRDFSKVSGLRFENWLEE